MRIAKLRAQFRDKKENKFSSNNSFFVSVFSGKTGNSDERNVLNEIEDVLVLRGLVRRRR